LLSIYDLSKIVEPNLKITNTRLLVKSGGKKGLWTNPNGIPEKIKKVLNL
jgi:cyclic pyranopterin phosphate synthase